MNFKETLLKGVYKISPTTNFKDFRGNYIETYNKKIFYKNNFKINFVQDDFSISKKNVLRGIHGDKKTWKLVSCIEGKFFLVVVNYDKNSDQYLKHITFNMSSENYYEVLIPPKFGNAHYVVSKKAIFHYKQSTYYNRAGQFTLNWRDERLKIKWPGKKFLLSSRDKTV